MLLNNETDRTLLYVQPHEAGECLRKGGGGYRWFKRFTAIIDKLS